MFGKLFRYLLFACLSFGTLAIDRAIGQSVIVGANIVADQASDHTKDDLLEQLQKYGVKIIRMALGGHGDRYTGSVVKAFQHGIGAVVIVNLRRAVPAPHINLLRIIGWTAWARAFVVGRRSRRIQEMVRLSACNTRSGGHISVGSEG